MHALLTDIGRLNAMIDDFWADPKPWMVSRAVEWLEANVLATDRVLEFGGGVSSLWWAERCTYTFTAEASPIWAAKLIEEMRKRPTALAKWGMMFSACEWNNNYSQPKPFWAHPRRKITASQAEQLERAYLNANVPFVPTVIVVDGSVRLQSLTLAERLARKISEIRLIVVDNADTPAISNSLVNKFADFDRIDFDETDPSRIPVHQNGSWRTTVYSR